MSPSDPKRFEEAIRHLAQDGFLAYPTETVWGLGACADRADAVERLMSWKGREEGAPLAVLVPSVAVAEEWGCTLSDAAQRLAAAFWPGPLMLVVPCRQTFATGVAGDQGALGLRCSSHPVAQALAQGVSEAGLGPLTSTSLNRTGQPPAANRDEAQAVLSAGLWPPDRAEPRWVFEASYASETAGEDEAGGALPSTVVDCTGAEAKILRVGAIAASEIEESSRRK